MNAPTYGFALRDLQTGCGILSRISLANPLRAATELEHFLDNLLFAPPESDILFQLLEQARLAVVQVEDELAKRYLNKPLPYGDVEEGIFRQVISLCLKTVEAYDLCARHNPTDAETPAHMRRVATILHRCLYHTGAAILEHQRARHEYPWRLWFDLHGYYASAEEWGVDKVVVTDPLEPLGRSTHCVACYAIPLLADLAGCYGLPARDLALVHRWAAHWAQLVSLDKALPGEALPHFVIDLMQDIALRPAVECLNTEQIRRLDTSRLAMHISQIRLQLHQQIPPGQLALGDNCTSGQCQRLLEQLSRPWSMVKAQRKFRRRAASGTTRLCFGFEEMHYFISGKEFEQPENVRAYSRREYDTLFAFRYQENPQQVLNVRRKEIAYAVDTWEVVNQSANGFRLVRSVSGCKISHGQLLALSPSDNGKFFLAQNVWLMQEQTGGLIAGIKTLPGLPMATAARLMDQNETFDGKYQRVFLLPEVAAENSPQSLVVPQGWYRNGRIVELHKGTAWQIRMLHILDSGPDFERIVFEIS